MDHESVDLKAVSMAVSMAEKMVDGSVARTVALKVDVSDSWKVLKQVAKTALLKAARWAD